MENSIIEANFPLEFRANDAKILGEHLRHRHNVELIGMKRVGISNFLKFFLYHKDIVPTYINHGENHFFIPVDLNDLVEREIYPFWMLTFKRLVDRVDESDLDKDIKEEISTQFLDSIQSRDLFLTIESLRKAISILVKQNRIPTIFFLRFDRLDTVVNNEFFANLQGLKEATGQKLSYVFTSFRSLDVIAPTVFSRKSLSVFSNLVHLKPASEPDMRMLSKSFEDKYSITASDELLSTLIELSGGHVQYLQLSLLVIHQRKEQELLDITKLKDLLLSDERIMLQSEEIWESLTADEQNVLLSIASNKELSAEAQTKAKYLWDTGIVLIKDNKNVIFSPLFASYIKDKDQRNVNKEENVEFSKKEHALYTFLFENIDQICEREQIIKRVWPEYEEFGVSDWTIDRLVARLRNKLKKQAAKFEIVTVKTRGYKLIENNKQ